MGMILHCISLQALSSKIPPCPRSLLGCRLYVLIRILLRSSTKASLCSASSQGLIISQAVKERQSMCCCSGRDWYFLPKILRPGFQHRLSGRLSVLVLNAQDKDLTVKLPHMSCKGKKYPWSPGYTFSSINTINKLFEHLHSFI